MKVYAVLVRDIYYEGDAIKGIFKSRKDAEDFQKACDEDEHFIEEHEVIE